MIAADTLESISKSVKLKRKNGSMIGLLLAHPHAHLSKEEILGHLDYFHCRSGNNIDFYCAGYGAYWPESEGENVSVINRTPWSFSSEKFSNVISQLESRTSWEYSGEVELILFNTDLSQPDGLNFYEVIVCNLEQMKKVDAFTSVRSFFEKIFREANNKDTWSTSDKFGLELGKRTLKEIILSTLPNSLANLYQRGEGLAIRDISKQA